MNTKIEIRSKMSREIEIKSFQSHIGGETIYGLRSYPKEALHSQKIVYTIFLHDLLDYHERYFLMPNFFMNKFKSPFVAGWMDFKGHGLSTGARNHLDEANSLAQDLIQYINDGLPKIDMKNVSIFIVAQGLGALIACDALLNFKNSLNYKISGLILLNPLVEYTTDQNSLLKKIGLTKFDVLKKLRFNHNLSALDLCNDPYLAETYEKDPLNVDFSTYGQLEKINQIIERVRPQPYYLESPTLCLLSKEDKLCDFQTMQLFSKGIDPKIRSIKVYPQAYHDLQNDIHRQDVFETTLNWINSQQEAL